MDTTPFIKNHQRPQEDKQFILALQRLAEEWDATLDLGSFAHIPTQDHEQS